MLELRDSQYLSRQIILKEDFKNSSLDKECLILDSPCDVWICAVVNVKHQSVCTFDKYRYGGFLGRVDERDGVDDIWSEVCSICLREEVSSFFTRVPAQIDKR